MNRFASPARLIFSGVTAASLIALPSVHSAKSELLIPNAIGLTSYASDSVVNFSAAATSPQTGDLLTVIDRFIDDFLYKAYEDSYIHNGLFTSELNWLLDRLSLVAPPLYDPMGSVGQGTTAGVDNSFGHNDVFGTDDHIGSGNTLGNYDIFGNKIILDNNNNIGQGNHIDAGNTIGSGNNIGDDNRIEDTNKIANRNNIGDDNQIDDKNVIGDSNNIGDDNQIGDANTIGARNNIGDAVTTGNNNTIGNANIIGSSTTLGSSDIIGSDDKIGAGTIFGNHDTLGNQITFGRGSTLGNNDHIGANNQFAPDTHLRSNQTIAPDTYHYHGSTSDVPDDQQPSQESIAFSSELKFNNALVDPDNDLLRTFFGEDFTQNDIAHFLGYIDEDLNRIFIGYPEEFINDILGVSGSNNTLFNSLLLPGLNPTVTVDDARLNLLTGPEEDALNVHTDLLSSATIPLEGLDF